MQQRTRRIVLTIVTVVSGILLAMVIMGAILAAANA